jgi:hypothetical protein
VADGGTAFTGAARAIVVDAAAQYFTARRERVDPFIDRHFSFRGSLRLHRHAIGRDIVRAPVNLTMAAPQAGLRAASAAAARLGADRTARALSSRSLLLPTDVGRQLAWLIHTELLELPCQANGRVSTKDALAETILTQAMRTGPLPEMLRTIAPRADDPALRQRIEHAFTEYAGSRTAAAEITTALFSLSAGALAFHKLTPGAASLGPALASMLAQQAAVSSFPFGAGLGSVWYSIFPAAPAFALVAGLTGGLVALASVASAFAGIAADPVQRRLGLHRRRLLMLLDSLEQQMRDPAAPAFALRDQYVARLLDLFDLAGAAYRLAR